MSGGRLRRQAFRPRLLRLPLHPVQAIWQGDPGQARPSLAREIRATDEGASRCALIPAPADPMTMQLTDDIILACSGSSWTGHPSRCRWCNRPLSGRQKRWCANCPEAWANNHFWTSARQRALERDDRTCVRCGETNKKRLQVHHVEHALGRHYQTDCIHHVSNLQTLCADCHGREHGWTASPSRGTESQCPPEKREPSMWERLGGIHDRR